MTKTEAIWVLGIGFSVRPAPLHAALQSVEKYSAFACVDACTSKKTIFDASLIVSKMSGQSD